MVEALAAYLHGSDLPAAGMVPRPAARLLWPLARGLNRLPAGLLKWAYGRSGWVEGIEERQVDRVDADHMTSRFVRAYPRRQYSTIMLGSSNGAAVHLAGLLGAPWLPQTFLVLVRHGGLDVDDPAAIARWGATGPGSVIAERNPDLVVHQMHDPNQDRLMSRHVGYFRGKRRVLGSQYEGFIERSLPPGGTLLTVECRKEWPASRTGERLRFQLGGLGGLEPQEYLEGSPQIEQHLAERGSSHRGWPAPEPDGDHPEAEWGFEPALLDDVRRVAKKKGYRLLRLQFDHPEDLSTLVAELFRHRRAGRSVRGNRLIADCFSLVTPWWVARTGAVPFWLAFNAEPSAERLERYLDASGPFDEIHLLILQHGEDSIGLASGERWQGLADRAETWGRLVAVSPEQHPRNFSVFLGLQEELARIPARYPLPSPMPVDEFVTFVDEHGERHGIALESEAT